MPSQPAPLSTQFGTDHPRRVDPQGADRAGRACPRRRRRSRSRSGARKASRPRRGGARRGRCRTPARPRPAGPALPRPRARRGRCPASGAPRTAVPRPGEDPHPVVGGRVCRRQQERRLGEVRPARERAIWSSSSPAASCTTATGLPRQRSRAEHVDLGEGVRRHGSSLSATPRSRTGPRSARPAARRRRRPPRRRPGRCARTRMPASREQRQQRRRRVAVVVVLPHRDHGQPGPSRPDRSGSWRALPWCGDLQHVRPHVRRCPAAAGLGGASSSPISRIRMPRVSHEQHQARVVGWRLRARRRSRDGATTCQVSGPDPPASRRTTRRCTGTPAAAATASTCRTPDNGSASEVTSTAPTVAVRAARPRARRRGRRGSA